jgi:hypothetical protein
MLRIRGEHQQEPGHIGVTRNRTAERFDTGCVVILAQEDIGFVEYGGTEATEDSERLRSQATKPG